MRSMNPGKQRAYSPLTGLILAALLISAAAYARSGQLPGVEQPATTPSPAPLQGQFSAAWAATQPVVPLPPGSASRGEALFSGETRLQNGGPAC